MMDTREAVELCVNYIEGNLYGKISLDDISENIGVSKFYLHRIFRALTGESIMEYVQLRKLTSSIDELISSNERIIDIALNYGFDYEQSYIRAFKKAFGCTPAKIRSDRTTLRLEIKEKINMNDILSVGNSVTYRPYFSFMQKFDLIGIKHKLLSKSGDKTANGFGKDFFYNNKHRITNTVNPHVYFGYTEWGNNDSGFIYYIPSVQVTDLRNIPKGMVGISVPAHKYVIFRFVGFFSPDDISGRHVGRLLVQLYSKWIFKSGYKFADTFRFEYIDTSLSNDNYCELSVCQPIIDMNSAAAN